MEKQLQILRKMKKPKQPSRPSSAQPGRVPARLCRLTGGFHLLAAVPFPARSLSLSLPSGAGLSVPVAFPCAPLSPSASRAHLVRAPNRYPHAPTLSLSLAVPWDCPVSSAFPAPAVDQDARTHARTPRSPTTSPAHTPQLLF
jgi:hypothetical protein